MGRDPSCIPWEPPWADGWLTITPPHVFHKYIILKGVEVVCFDRLLQVLILNGLRSEVPRRGRGLRGRLKGK